MRKFWFAAVMAAAIGVSAPALASTTINGSIFFGGGSTNYYDPVNGYVPGGFGNSSGLPVTIGGGTEFGFQDSANTDTADFTDTTLQLVDVVHSSAANWTQMFTASTAGFFNGISLVGATLTPLSYSVADDTLTVNWGGAQSPGAYTANFTFSGGAVPEPATWAMMLLGFGGLGCVLRNRRAQAAAVTA